MQKGSTVKVGVTVNPNDKGRPRKTPVVGSSLIDEEIETPAVDERVVKIIEKIKRANPNAYDYQFGMRVKTTVKRGGSAQFGVQRGRRVETSVKRGGAGYRRGSIPFRRFSNLEQEPQAAKEQEPQAAEQEPQRARPRGILNFIRPRPRSEGILKKQLGKKTLLCSVLKKHPSKFVGCCLANPAEDGSGIQQLEHLILIIQPTLTQIILHSYAGYRVVRFNPYLWPSGQQMTNDIGKEMFSKAGELGVPVRFMCMKGLNLHISEIEKLCTEFPKTVVSFTVAFCKPPIDFPFVVKECGYKEAKEAVSLIANQVPLSSSDLEWIMGKTGVQLFHGQWVAS
ncbi:4-sulfomuconolactone hydrolase [Tanacetum coccineum]